MLEQLDSAEAETTVSPDPVSVQMPGSWNTDLGSAFSGRVRYRRFFNKPTSIDPTTPIELVFERVVGHARIHLNDELLGEIAWPQIAGRFDLRGKLISRSEIVVEISSLSAFELEAITAAGEVAPAPGLVGEVRIEIS